MNKLVGKLGHYPLFFGSSSKTGTQKHLMGSVLFNAPSYARMLHFRKQSQSNRPNPFQNRYVSFNQNQYATFNNYSKKIVHHSMHLTPRCSISTIRPEDPGFDRFEKFPWFYKWFVEHFPPIDWISDGFVAICTHILHFQDQLNNIASVFPWWQTIILIGTSFQLILWPLSRIGHQNMKKLNESMEFQLANIHLRREINRNRRKKIESGIEIIKKKLGFSPWKNYIQLILAIPLGYLFAISLRLCTYSDWGMASGGLWWFTDLISVDPYRRLPVMSLLLILLGIEASRKVYQVPPFMNFIFRAIPIAFFPIWCFLPNSINFYIFVASFLQLCKTLYSVYSLFLQEVKQQKMSQMFMNGSIRYLDEQFSQPTLFVKSKKQLKQQELSAGYKTISDSLCMSKQYLVGMIKTFHRIWRENFK